MADSRVTGGLAGKNAVWAGPLPPHTLENVGGSELRGISVEVKEPEAEDANPPGPQSG